MKTDDTKGEYVTAEETTDALEMPGKGYNTDPIPPNDFVATVSGFTLAPDAIINEHGYVTALVWGVAWRFCQMSDGVCRASLEKIAARLGMSERTIIRHLDTLCGSGFLFDTTPTLKNKPHIYADTGKIKVRMNIHAMTESQRAMTESQRQGDRESVEESIKKEYKDKNSLIKKPTARAERTPEEQAILDDMKMAALLNTLSPKAIQDAIAKHFRLTPRWETKEGSQWMEWAMAEKITPEQIEAAAELWRVDKRFNWSIPTLKGIRDHWLELAQPTTLSPSNTPDARETELAKFMRGES
jgi:DNA-binding Lrp family transcriptional regulator